MNRKRHQKPVNYAENMKSNRNAVLDIKREDINRMRNTIIKLNEDLNRHGPQLLTEDEISETIQILVTAADESRKQTDAEEVYDINDISNVSNVNENHSNLSEVK